MDEKTLHDVMGKRSGGDQLVAVIDQRRVRDVVFVLQTVATQKGDQEIAFIFEDDVFDGKHEGTFFPMKSHTLIIHHANKKAIACL
jgi:hypothetical protein